MSKYGFGGGGIELPKPSTPSNPRPKIEPEVVERAVQAGTDLGFVNREPSNRLRPGPKRSEPQDKVSIPGPKRVIDDFRNYCRTHNMTLWQGLDYLLTLQNNRQR
jgi:hypothetical protein